MGRCMDVTNLFMEPPDFSSSRDALIERFISAASVYNTVFVFSLPESCLPSSITDHHSLELVKP